MASKGLAAQEPASDQPGCLQAVSARAIDEESTAKLPRECQVFYRAYTSGLKQFADQPEAFVKGLKNKIESAKTEAPPYTAILLSVLSQNEDQNKIILPALEKRAQIESQKKLHHSYARAALSRIKDGQCSPEFEAQAYSEICTMTDPIYGRIAQLNENQNLHERLLKDNRPSKTAVPTSKEVRE